jgi:PAS domain S-box-containing protein
VNHSLDWFSKHLIDVLPAAVYVCDMNATVVASNQRAVELWGRTPRAGEQDEKFCGSHKMFLSSGVHLPHHECPMEVVLRTGQAASDEEVVIERPDGSRVTVLVNIKPLFDQAGIQVGAVNCFQDLTAQKSAERERANLREELRQGQKLQAIGQLVGGVAHDFNNLLAPIIGNLDMLSRRDGRDARETRQISGAILSAQRAKVLVQRLLSFARRQPLQAKPVDLGLLVSGMVELIGSTTGSKIQLVLDLALGLPLAKVDPNQVEIAILNLVVNARDAMPNGGTLTISASSEIIDVDREPKLQAGRYVRLSVRDTGTGMDQETMTRAVEPFFSMKGVGQGTGLGLSMADGLASQSGGTLMLTSALGRGTTIDLFLPVSVEAVSTAAVPHILKPAARGIGRVLLVDDEPLVRECTADMLTDLGYEVIEAKSAEEALSLLENDTGVDGVISDYLMPGLSGAELVQVLRVRGFAVPVLIISGFAHPLHIAPDQPFLTKPLTQAELAASLVELLEHPAVPQRKLSLVRTHGSEAIAPE